MSRVSYKENEYIELSNKSGQTVKLSCSKKDGYILISDFNSTYRNIRRFSMDPKRYA